MKPGEAAMPPSLLGQELAVPSAGHMGAKQEGVLKKTQQAANEPQAANETVPPPPDLGLRADDPTVMAAQGVLMNQGAQQMLVGVVDGGKGKSKYQPKKCDHGR